MVKRSFDILLSLLGLILLSPFLCIIAILMKLDSKGPLLFRQVRVGKNGLPFQILKFRTMMDTKHWSGPPLSPMNDPRVTSMGAILRRFKINELPQLINVLKGDMSFVGPRPEVPEFVSFYSPQERKILSVRPGIVGPSQIHMRNEEELYAEDADPQEYYVKHILPKKLRVDLDYIHSRSFLKDMGYLLQGIAITITGAITKRHLFENAEQIALFVCDCLICAFSYFLSYFLRVEGELVPIHQPILLSTLPYVIMARMLVLMYFGLYSSMVQYFSFHEFIRVVKGVTISSALIILLTFLIGERSHPRSVFAIDWFIVVFLLGGYRLSFKAVTEYVSQNKNGSSRNILIYGAGAMGDLALRYLKAEGRGKVIAFIDDDPKKMRKSFQGVKVLGNRYDIEALVRIYHIDEIFVATNNVGFENLEDIKSLCERVNVRCEVFALAN